MAATGRAPTSVFLLAYRRGEQGLQELHFQIVAFRARMRASAGGVFALIALADEAVVFRFALECTPSARASTRRSSRNPCSLIFTADGQPLAGGRISAEPEPTTR